MTPPRRLDQEFADQIERAGSPPESPPGTRIVLAVIGKDRPGIMAGVTAILAARRANILDVTQTILGGLFTMLMVVDTAGMEGSFADLKRELETHGQQQALSILLQREEIFHAMHRL